MLYFVVEYKARHQGEWTMVSNSVKPSGNYVVLDLTPATWYQIRVTAHNNVGFTQAEFEFATLTIMGNILAPPSREDSRDFAAEWIAFISGNLNLVVPVVTAVIVIFTALITICALRRGKTDNVHKAKIGPVRSNDYGQMRMLELFPWLPEWVDYNMLIAGLAIVVIITVGIVVICVAVARRNRGPESVRLRDEGLYAQPDMRGMTLKREYQGELGYIAPPNRKLPPVPGSNYSTCDRIKKGQGTYWNPKRIGASSGGPNTYEELAGGDGGNYYEGKPPVPPHGHANDDSYSRPVNGGPGGPDEDICPYATFHLLGFREEMDPQSLAQTLPHPGHHRGGPQNVPRGTSTTRYGRGPVGSGVVSSVAGGGTVGPNGMLLPSNNVFSPEYDDPANIEDEYGYNSPNRRGSLGRRSMGSIRAVPIPESPSPPPPPPPRPVDGTPPYSTPSHCSQNNESTNSANDSKESNEMSEAECDRDPLIRNRNSVGGASGNQTEEMRRLLEKNEAAHPIPNGLTPYDTVNV